MLLHTYSLFHLNLNYSAIEREQHHEVIERCYFPLLNLCQRAEIPFAIELTGHTLERIAEVSPDWVELFNSLLRDNRCELIGSGYAQIIAPIVPYQLTQKNLQLGNETYQKILGVIPKIALLNEQSYSGGSIEAYSEQNYDAFIMEWENPFLANQWSEAEGFLPRRISGSDLPVIWNHSTSFQKFQRFVHGDISLNEYFEYIKAQVKDTERVFSIYGNDVEIFDFRPGRYMTEAALPDESEWLRIESLYNTLKEFKNIRFCKPGDLLKLNQGDELRLESAAYPVPVKKQPKYNITRWSVTGRNDYEINTRCRNLFERLVSQETSKQEWKDLCFLWSSDFRTHITEKRWKEFQTRLGSFECKLRPVATNADPTGLAQKEFANSAIQGSKSTGKNQSLRWKIVENALIVEGERLRLSFNQNRGLSLKSFTDLEMGDDPLWGTLPHGKFQDIRWAADFYSGHVVLEAPGRAKLTDLSKVSEQIRHTETGLRIRARIDTPRGPVEKIWSISDRDGRVTLQLNIDWKEPFLGSLRLGHLTLMPEAFEKGSLFYETHLGAKQPTRFNMEQKSIEHGRPVSFLVSTTQSLGLTEGYFAFGDHRRQVEMHFRPADHALVGLVSHQCFADTHFTRVALSAREMDDTSRPAPFAKQRIELEYRARSVV